MSTICLCTIPSTNPCCSDSNILILFHPDIGPPVTLRPPSAYIICVTLTYNIYMSGIHIIYFAAWLHKCAAKRQRKEMHELLRKQCKQDISDIEMSEMNKVNVHYTARESSDSAVRVSNMWANEFAWPMPCARWMTRLKHTNSAFTCIWLLWSNLRVRQLPSSPNCRPAPVYFLVLFFYSLQHLAIQLANVPGRELPFSVCGKVQRWAVRGKWIVRVTC